MTVGILLLNEGHPAKHQKSNVGTEAQEKKIASRAGILFGADDVIKHHVDDTSQCKNPNQNTRPQRTGTCVYRKKTCSYQRWNIFNRVHKGSMSPEDKRVVTKALVKFTRNEVRGPGSSAGCDKPLKKPRHQNHEEAH